MQKILSVCLAVVLVAAVPGCTTMGVRDPVKTEQVKAALTPLASAAVRRVLASNPSMAPFVARVGSALASVRDGGEFDPLVLATALDGVIARSSLSPEDKLLALDFKDTVLALYEIQFAGRFQVDLPENEFLADVLDVIAAAIERGTANPGA